MVEDYLENDVQLDESSFSQNGKINVSALFDDFIAFIDSKELSKKIVDSLQDRILQYNSTCEGVHLSCDKCFRPFGTWKTKIGHDLGEHLVSSQGKRILIIDDF